MSKNLMQNLSPWLARAHQELILPRRKVIENHPFMVAMMTGASERSDAVRYFSGLMWHLLDFGKHVSFLFEKRPKSVAKILEGRSEDKDGDTDILARIVDAFGGSSQQIASSPWTFSPHPVWVRHDALLRSAIYSPDLPWQVGAAALNVGIESLVPFMIEPLFGACIKNYGVTTSQAAWLASRAGEEEKQHGENGYLILQEYVAESELKLQEQCRFFIDALSRSMAYGLLESGRPQVS